MNTNTRQGDNLYLVAVVLHCLIRSRINDFGECGFEFEVYRDESRKDVHDKVSVFTTFDIIIWWQEVIAIILNESKTSLFQKEEKQLADVILVLCKLLTLKMLCLSNQMGKNRV